MWKISECIQAPYKKNELRILSTIDNIAITVRNMTLSLKYKISVGYAFRIFILAR